MNSKNFLRVIGLIFILVILGGCSSEKKNDFTYVNKEYGYSFKYPLGTKIFEVPSSSPQGPIYPYLHALEIRGADTLQSKFMVIRVVLRKSDNPILDFAKNEHKVTLELHPDMVSFQETTFKGYSAVQVSNTYEPYFAMYVQVKDKIYIFDLNNWRGNFNSVDYNFFQGILSTLEIDKN